MVLKVLNPTLIKLQLHDLSTYNPAIVQLLQSLGFFGNHCLYQIDAVVESIIYPLIKSKLKFVALFPYDLIFLSIRPPKVSRVNGGEFCSTRVMVVRFSGKWKPKVSRANVENEWPNTSSFVRRRRSASAIMRRF